MRGFPGTRRGPLVARPATEAELLMLERNCEIACVLNGLSEDSRKQAHASAREDRSKAARCYGALVRSLSCRS